MPHRTRTPYLAGRDLVVGHAYEVLIDGGTRVTKKVVTRIGHKADRSEFAYIRAPEPADNGKTVVHHLDGSESLMEGARPPRPRRSAYGRYDDPGCSSFDNR
jgi:hypothetical protein